MFQKDDKKKLRLELIDPTFINGVGAVLTFGAEKYDDNNWQSATADDIERIRGAMLRHHMALASGESIDPDSGLHHAYHIAANAMFLAWHDRNSEINPKQKIMVFDEDGGID